MHYYKILRHNAGFDEGTNYWEKLLARYVAATGGGKIHTTLPITFTSTSWKLVSWTIYGNDDIGKNLLPLTNYNLSGLGNVTYIVDEQSGTVILNGSTTTTVGAQIHIIFEPSETLKVYFSGCPDGGSSTKYDVYCWDWTTNARCKRWDESTASTSDYGDGSCEATLIANHVINLNVRLHKGYIANNLTFKPMLRLADTSPEFEPYQIGVGERTKNYFDVDDYFTKAYVKSNVTFTKSGNDLKITATNTNDPYVNGSVGNGSILNEQFRGGLMPVQAGDTLTFSCTTSAPIYYFISFVDSNYKGIADLIKSNESSNTFTIPQNCKYILIRFANSQMTANQEYTISNIMLVEGSTAPTTFIPYGYEVPLTVSQTWQTITNADLEQGYTDTDTTKTYEQNKKNATNRLRTPTLIDPDSSVQNIIAISNGFEFAIRWYTNGLYTSATGWLSTYTIPTGETRLFGLTIRHPDNSDITNAESIMINVERRRDTDIYIGASPLTEGRTVSNTQDIEVFEGENTIDTTLYNKPVMEIEYE